MVGVAYKPRLFSVSVSGFITATRLSWLSQCCAPPIWLKAFVVVKESEGILVHSVAPLWRHLLLFYGNQLPDPGTITVFLGSQKTFTWYQHCPVSGLQVVLEAQ